MAGLRLSPAMTILFALSAALVWGVADFVGGMASRRVSVITVLLLTELGGLIVIGAVVAATTPEMFSREDAIMSMAAGLIGTAALGLFYRALAIGTMSVVAPITATGAVIPVIVGLATGDALSVVQVGGLAVVLVGVVLASREQSSVEAPSEEQRRSIVLAVAAAVGFGLFFLLSHPPAEESVGWTVFFLRLAQVPVVAGIWLWLGAQRPGPKLTTVLLCAGTLDLGATALLALANSGGEVSIVSVLTSTYPVVTVLLAAVVLHERLLRSQYVGIVLTLAGIGAVVAG